MIELYHEQVQPPSDELRLSTTHGKTHSSVFDPFDQKTEYSSYTILENKGTFIIGQKDYNPNKGRMIAIDLEKKQAGYWVGNIKNFKKFYTSCKLYKGGSSTLKSSLGNSSGTFKNILGKYLGK